MGTGFPKRSCSNKKIERDDDSKKSHPAQIELRDGHSSGRVDGDLTELQSRTTTPKGAAAIGGAAPIPESRPLGRVHQSPELRAPVRDAADRVVSADLLIPAEFCRAPMAGAI